MKLGKKIPYSKAFLVVGTIMMTEGCVHIDNTALEMDDMNSLRDNRETNSILASLKSEKNGMDGNIRTLKQMSHSISAAGILNPEQLAGFLLSRNKAFTRVMALEVATSYWEEGRVEGINSDIAFAQMCLETNYLQFTGTVKPEQNNMCGLGVVSDKVQGHSFPTVQIGVRAHIQHLKAYGSNEPLNRKLVDPRFNLVQRNISPELSGLTGHWALDTKYDVKIASLMDRMHESAIENSEADTNIVKIPKQFELVL